MTEIERANLGTRRPQSCRQRRARVTHMPLARSRKANRLALIRSFFVVASRSRRFQRPLRQKFFAPQTFTRRTRSSALRRTHIEARRCDTSAASSRRAFKKCAVYRHFSLGSDFARLGRVAKIFHRDIRDAIARSSAIAGGEAAAIHNIKWIHCYFFSAGVIGIPVQIEFATALYRSRHHPLMLGGQQWRRSER